MANSKTHKKALTGFDLNKLPAAEKEKISGLFNAKLKTILADLAGKNKSLVNNLIKTKPVSFEKAKDLTPREFFDKFLLKEAKKQKLDNNKIKELQQRLKEVTNGKISDLLDLDAPLKYNAIVGAEVRKNTNIEIAKIAGISNSKIKKYIEKDLPWDEINAASLKPLLDEKIITKKQSDELLLIGDMARLSGDNIELIKALKREKITAIEELSSWTKQDWLTFIKNKKISLPEGEKSTENYTLTIFNNIIETYPTAYLTNRLTVIEVPQKLQLLSSVERLKKKNEVIIHGTEFSANRLNWTGINSNNRKRIEKELEELTEFSNTYKHLGIRSILNNKKLNKAQKSAAIKARLNAFSKFNSNNKGIDLYQENFISSKNNFNWNGVEEDSQGPVRKQMMALQRVQVLADDPQKTEILLRTGFDSAMSIASISEDTFYARSGLDYESSRNIYLKAKEAAIKSSNYFEAVRDGLSGTFKKLAINNQGELVNDLKEIDGFDELFGNQNFCDCEHCRSIFSPAAYFTDLMYFIQEHVSEKYFDPENPDHPLFIKNRRPDLWNLEFTCENTNTLIPYLQVVNEVLEAFIKKAENIDDVYKFINEANYSPVLPLNIPLEELRIYLGHFDENLFAIYKLLNNTEEQFLAEKLLLSNKEVVIINTPDPNQNHERFASISLSDLPVQSFLELIKITREELDQLLSTSFDSDISNVNVKRIKDETDIQLFHEELNGMTKLRLDSIYRYIKLWKKTPWTLPEFDLILNSLKSAGVVSNFTGLTPSGFPKFLRIGYLLIIQEKMGLSPEELSALIDNIPTTSIKENKLPLFERIFDLEKLFGIDSIANNGTITYKPSFDLPGDKSNDDKSSLILAGLGIAESELKLLFDLLNIDLSVDQTITHGTLSQLYKNARIARGLGWNIEDYVRACSLVLNGSAITQINDVITLIAFQEWVEPSPFSISDILFIVKDQESSGLKFETTRDEIAATIFEQRQNLENKDKLELLKIHLEKKFNLTQDQLRDQINNNLLSIDLDGPEIDLALNAAFDNSGVPDNISDFDGLLTVIKELERWQLLFRRLDFDTESITYLINNPGVFGINNFKSLKLDDLQQMYYYHALVQEKEDTVTQSLHRALIQYSQNGNFSTISMNTFAETWELSTPVISGVNSILTLPAKATEAVNYLYKVTSLADKLGLEGISLQKLTKTDFEDLKVARDIALGAIAAKYPEESKRDEILEPYKDKVNTLRRDALCDAIIGKKAQFKFKDRSDLYGFFLLDVDMSGCFRTSRIVSANSSLQLYIHRCLINLEQSDENLNPNITDIKVNPADISTEEWSWRKNYRVWEANRKIFLYPESYLDPALRDTKTHIFQELEDELLQEKVSQNSAEEAYMNYMAKFSELTKLRFAGAHYNGRSMDNNFLPVGNETNKMYMMMAGTLFHSESRDSLYYLFARTNTDPYQYYYRTYQKNNNVWGNWIKMEVAIEADEISALIHNGRLYIFWNDVLHKEVNKINDGNSVRIGHDFKVHVKYCYLKEDGSWTAPQKVYVGHTMSKDDEIFKRVFKKKPLPIDSKKEKILESVLEEYKRLVFRKPYAIKNSSNYAAPVKIKYIWSQNRIFSNIIYSTKNTTHSLSSGTIKLFVPAVTFPIINNDFSSAFHSKKIGLTLKFLGQTISGLEVNGEIRLITPNNCIVNIDDEVEVRVNAFNIKLPVKVNLSLSVSPNRQNTSYQNIKTSSFDLSLSKNKILNADIEDITEEVDSIYILKPEFDTAFVEDGDFDHYIENGSIGFTSSYRKIHQSADGYGHLLIPAYFSHIKSHNVPIDTIPITTILTDEIIDLLYAKGLEEFLSLQTQNLTDSYGDTFDMKGAYGEYYWEMFFHIPFLIANHLNANQKFEEAKWWYERIFNPTANKESGIDETNDHFWQFREFRNLGIQKLKDVLTDTNAIEAYKNDPFDPHAIARLRISAYQKAIVMKYIDNLIDWGDHLFTRDTRESITEAMQYYQLAYDLLGEKPIKLGSCETIDNEKLTYDKLKEKIDEGSEFLIALENSYLSEEQDFLSNLEVIRGSKYLANWSLRKGITSAPSSIEDVKKLALATDLIAPLKNASKKISTSDITINAGNTGSVSLSSGSKYGKRIEKYENLRFPDEVFNKRYEFLELWEDTDTVKREDVIENKPAPLVTAALVNQAVLAFCIPENKDLLYYWERVEDRMNKIRYCMNISGIRRTLDLFSPEIDPNFLVRGAALGLSLEDIIQIVGNANNLPKYRFVYLIEKARQFAQTVQGFGNSLLSAMEKKDVEELVLLRSVHEQNILKFSLDMKKKQVKEAKYQLKATEETLKNVQNRIDYYQDLLDTGLIAWERTQQISKHTASSLRTVSSIFYSSSGIYHLLPQIGSPFAFAYGGDDTGKSAKEWGDFMNTLASIADNVSTSAGLEAGNQRREQEWKNQLKLATQEKKASDQQLLAAEIREIIAEKDLEVHEKSIAQAKETHEFYKNKFTRLSLYNHLSSNLSKLYREGFNIASSMAKMAEVAYRLECFDDNTIFVQNDNWESDKAGLLAADRLLLQIQQMDKSYIEKNVRIPEITQTFSLSILSPGQLTELKQKGSCTIQIPKIAFDVLYPGQYRRIIKSVRLTIPCVIGPYTNVSAKLSLTKSQLELNDGDTPTDYEVAENTSINTSGAINDTGMFEFNFRDERYLPFEGAGAISEWTLQLPSKVRTFNYDTISDVLLTISYTALEGDRVAAENSISQELIDYVTNTGLQRLFSLKHEFSQEFHKLLNPEADSLQTANFEINDSHFPYVLRFKDLSIIETKVYLKPKSGQSITLPNTFKLNGNKPVSWSTSEDVSHITNAKVDKIKGGTVDISSGSPIKSWSIDAGIEGLKKEELDDIYILIKYKIV